MAHNAVQIRDAGIADAPAIAGIYNHYVAGTVVTFEEQPVEPTEMARRMQDVTARQLPWLVAELDGSIAGYAYAAPWRTRAAYRFSAETTVYLAPGLSGHGIGSLLYQRLLSALRARGVHAVIGGIALPNAASVRLHEKFGFTKVAHFAQVGCKSGQWVDVGYWQIRLRDIAAEEQS